MTHTQKEIKPCVSFPSPPPALCPPLQAVLSATDMALALNRYLCAAVLPLLTKCAPLFAGTEPYASLIDSLLHTVYRLSKGCCLTKAQRDAIEDCLLAVCG